MNNDLAAALNEIIAAAAPVAAAPSTIEQDFTALLAGTTPRPAPTHPVRDPLTGGVFTFRHTLEEAEALGARLVA
ncbi:hypothetical protein [Methylobacterium ajmalii]|jgi:hypothetical protein|uniref:hypothetical protein n=1 Tax=Methylobacterium ajmalii TaxID=2738439 RepID=UPI00190E10B6|nr:hypothetical protein [Methylobacterium ajmalii]MBK3398906.1 hypothetical protein [Methylobacterium ajmalii]MBK3409563.1 hypothetical protein [Methylobacterium ajmalii]MBK3425670.1 hypothetical protein [Methylobacterium ajmalii]